jgi:hypothetical protein
MRKYRTVHDHVRTPRVNVGAGSTFGGAVPASQASMAWIKSGRCESNACVEVALAENEILVRSSEASPVLRFTRDEWVAFVGGVRDGDFDFGLVHEQSVTAG